MVDLMSLISYGNMGLIIWHQALIKRNISPEAQ